ncbi:MAG: ribose-phosphate diphosphokinase [Candidatus Diapherotrites archaeon]
MLVFGLSQGQIAKNIALHLGVSLGKIETKHFPDGELYIRFLNNLENQEVVLVQSTHPEPDKKLVELFFAGRTAKELGAKKVIGVLPYLCYMRQDKRFKEGECVSNKMMAFMLNHCLDKIITVDPHLHRVKSLAELFHIEWKKVSANNKIAEFITKNFNKKQCIIIGPDIESSQWAKRIAEKIGFESGIFLKTRYSSRKVSLKEEQKIKVKGKKVIIVDDIVSSGHTMLEAIKEVKKRGAKEVDCVCIHGIFAENSYEKIVKVKAKVFSCNTIIHKSNKIDVSEEIAKALKE